MSYPIGVLVWAVLCATGAPPPPQKPGPEGLKALWEHIVALSLKGDHQAAAECLAATALSEKDLLAALGPPGARLWPEYSKEHLPKMRSMWAPQVNKYVGRGLTEVQVVCVQDQGDKVNLDESGTLPVLRPGLKLYRVALVDPKNPQNRWLYTSFVFVNDHWAFLGPVARATWKHYPGSDGLRALVEDVQAALADGNRTLAERRVRWFLIDPDQLSFFLDRWVSPLIGPRYAPRSQTDLKDLTERLLQALAVPQPEIAVEPVDLSKPETLTPEERTVAPALREGAELYRLRIGPPPGQVFQPVVGQYLDPDKKQFNGWRYLGGLVPLVASLRLGRPASDWKPAYELDRAGLEQLFTDMRAAMKEGQVGLARAIFESLEARESDYQALFGQSASVEMWKYYSHPRQGYWPQAGGHVAKWLVESLRANRGVARAVDITQRDPEQLSRSDRLAVAALAARSPLYQVFFLAKPEDDEPDAELSQRFLTPSKGRWVYLADVSKFVPRPRPATRPRPARP